MPVMAKWAKVLGTYPPELMKKFMADLERVHTDDAHRKMFNDNGERMFAESDTNNNGLLELKEYVDFCARNDAFNSERFGTKIVTPLEPIEAGWGFFNTLT